MYLEPLIFGLERFVFGVEHTDLGVELFVFIGEPFAFGFILLEFVIYLIKPRVFGV